MKYFPHIIIGIVAIAVIAGFFVVGSPTEQRVLRFDNERVSDLQSIQWQIINYWQSKERLPETINELRNEISGFIPPRDPVLDTEYGYEKRGAQIFALCATFSRPTPEKNITIIQPEPKSVSTGQNEVWEHREGRICFERKIDKDLYPPFRTQGTTPEKATR